MKDNTIKILLGIIAFCLCGLLIEQTSWIRAQSVANRGGQAQIATSGSTVYVLSDGKLTAYSWESSETKEMFKGLIGDVHLKPAAVIDLKAPHR